MIQLASNGGRGRDFHPAVPINPAELAADARRAVAAGAEALHVHPRDGEGRETLEPVHVESVLRAIRAAVPGVPVGISTGQWIQPFGSARISCLRRLEVRPDYVSVNVSEPDSEEVISAALGLGIGVEAGIFTVEDAGRFAGFKRSGACLRVLVEIGEQPPAADPVSALEQVVSELDRRGVRLPVLAHGFDDGFWPVARAAARRGFDQRCGLEDGRLLPDGTTASDNTALVAALRTLVQIEGSSSAR